MARDILLCERNPKGFRCWFGHHLKRNASRGADRTDVSRLRCTLPEPNLTFRLTIENDLAADEPAWCVQTPPPPIGWCIRCIADRTAGETWCGEVKRIQVVGHEPHFRPWGTPCFTGMSIQCSCLLLLKRGRGQAAWVYTVKSHSQTSPVVNVIDEYPEQTDSSSNTANWQCNGIEVWKEQSPPKDFERQTVIYLAI